MHDGTENAPAQASFLHCLAPRAVGDWEAAGAQFFSRELLYDMQWADIDLETKRWVARGWRLAGCFMCRGPVGCSMC